ncbi:MAG: hypothetical protein AAB610_00180 [Patescibacteria group bacterium]
MKNKCRTQEGFVALTLVIMAASLTLAFSFMQSVEIGHFFDMTLRKEYRLMNHFNAYNCIDQAILANAHDYFYEVAEPQEIPDLHCVIDSVREENGFKLIDAHGNFKNGNVKMSAIIRLYDNGVEIISID